MFTGLYSLVIGLIGVAWRLAVAEAPARVNSDSGSAGTASVSRPEAMLPAGG